MDFETFKKTKLESSGMCPKCVKHFDRLRTHANSCLKGEFEKYLSLPNANTSSISIKESKSVQDLQTIQKPEKKKVSTSDLKSGKSNFKKTKSDEEIKVKKETEIAQPLVPSDSTDSITSKIKIQDKPQTDKLEQAKFQEFFETVIEKLKTQSLSDGSCQYRFDFVKLRCDVKKIQTEAGDSNRSDDKFNRNDLYSDMNSKQMVPNKKQKITSVLLVSNLDADSVTIDALFILFGVYGDVQRIKMIDKKLCFIEFTNKEQAEVAMENLDNCKLWSKPIKVYPCAHETISPSRDSNERNCILKDFSNSHLHRYRYRKPDSPSYINKPSATLHLSNIPTNVTTNELNYLFERYGRVAALRFHPNQGNKALIQMGSVEEGVLALINNHGKQLSKNVHLRCNFHHRNVNNF